MLRLKASIPIVLATVAIFLLSGNQSSYAEESFPDRLNGTWTSDLMTITFDTENSCFHSVSMGRRVTRPISLVEQKANAGLFETDEYNFTVQFQEDGSIVATKEEGIPLKMNRADQGDWENLHDRLNGTWVCDLITITYDFDNGTVEFIGMGRSNSRPLKLVEEVRNVVICRTDNFIATAQFQEDARIFVTKQGRNLVILSYSK